jgi:hypothetical protein
LRVRTEKAFFSCKNNAKGKKDVLYLTVQKKIVTITRRLRQKWENKQKCKLLRFATKSGTNQKAQNTSSYNQM